MASSGWSYLHIIVLTDIIMNRKRPDASRTAGQRWMGVWIIHNKQYISRCVVLNAVSCAALCLFSLELCGWSVPGYKALCTSASSLLASDALAVLPSIAPQWLLMTLPTLWADEQGNSKKWKWVLWVWINRTCSVIREVMGGGLFLHCIFTGTI